MSPHEQDPECVATLPSDGHAHSFLLTSLSLQVGMLICFPAVGDALSSYLGQLPSLEVVMAESVLEFRQKLAFMERLTRPSMDKSRKRCENNENLKVMKRLPPWNSKKLEESYQAKEMEYGFAGRLDV